jgi:hypothetical protein
MLNLDVFPASDANLLLTSNSLANVVFPNVNHLTPLPLGGAGIQGASVSTDL